nr:MAG TPA: hypothetical protein [Caudoviricetes sp.]
MTGRYGCGIIEVSRREERRVGGGDGDVDRDVVVRCKSIGRFQKCVEISLLYRLSI